MRLRVVLVLYATPAASLQRALAAAVRSLRIARAAGAVSDATLAVGDCSPQPLLDEPAVGRLRAHADAAGVGLTHSWFGANLGHAGGSNTLAAAPEAAAPDDLLLFLNPDTAASPDLVARLVAALAADPRIALADARQLPLEHPKDFDVRTGDQSWASGACLLARRAAFDAVGGFDARWFPTYCDDVDLSWRVRLHGGRVVHVPQAVVFHDKRVDRFGGVRPTPTQEQASALARLRLGTRYDRPDVVRQTTWWIQRSGSPGQRRALAQFRTERAAGEVPAPLPQARSVACFVGGEYERRRF